MRKCLALACCLVALPAVAQTGTPLPGLDPVVPQWAEIETVHATAAPGPALWHVTKGASEVWILGMVGALPKGIAWNSKPLGEVMHGAHALIIGPEPHIDLGDISWFVITHCCSLWRLDSGKLDDFLPAATRARLTAMRQSVGGDARLYQSDEPIGAAQRLGSDFARKYNLGGGDPMSVVRKLAGSNDVPQQPIFRPDPILIIKEALKLTPQQQLPCLEAQMEDISRSVDHARPMGEAWAVGDVQGIKDNFAASRTTDCMAAAVRAFGARQQNLVPGFVGAIDAALATPGKTVAVIGLGPLLRQDGVLAQLQAQHLVIEGPAE